MSRTIRSQYADEIGRSWDAPRKGRHYKRAAAKAERQYVRRTLDGFNVTDRRISRTTSELAWKGT